MSGVCRFSISSLCMVCCLGVVSLSNFDFVILSYFTVNASCESLASVLHYFSSVFFFGRFLLLFVLVPPTHEFFMDSVICIFQGVGRLRGRCCFSLLMLRLRLRGLSAHSIVCLPYLSVVVTVNRLLWHGSVPDPRSFNVLVYYVFRGPTKRTVLLFFGLFGAWRVGMVAGGIHGD